MQSFDAPPISAGAFLNRTFSLLWSGGGAFFWLALLFGMPGIVLEGYTLYQAQAFVDQLQRGEFSFAGTSATLESIENLSKLRVGLDLFLGQILGVCLTQGVIQAIRDRDFTSGSLLRAGLPRFGRALGVSLLLGLYALLVIILPLIVASTVIVLTKAVMLLPLVAVLAIGGGVYFFLAYAPLVPIAVIEDRPLLDCLRRSRELVDGHRGSILGALLLFGLIVAGASFLSSIIGLASWTIALVLGGLVSVFVMVARNVLGAVVYHDLRCAKDGLDTDTIGAVFD